jgi:SiaC family regulatory phosphoprotein
MRAFRRKATDQTPAIDFDYDAHELRISGESWLEDAAKFWIPVLNSVREYAEKAASENITVDVQLSYLNTGSFKAMVQLCRSLEEAAKRGNTVVFNWRYRKDDEMARGYGEDLEASVRTTALRIRFEEEAL